MAHAQRLMCAWTLSREVRSLTFLVFRFMRMSSFKFSVMGVKISIQCVLRGVMRCWGTGTCSACAYACACVCACVCVCVCVCACLSVCAHVSMHARVCARVPHTQA